VKLCFHLHRTQILTEIVVAPKKNIIRFGNYYHFNCVCNAIDYGIGGNDNCQIPTQAASE
jgi:hypothetical protein